jgi:mono/diheme cytochrome c family protein
MPAGAALAEVTVPAVLPDEARIGQRVFEASCAECHGENAAGRNGAGPPLVHRIYEPSHHGDGAFLLAARNGVRAHHWTFGDMPAVEGITDAEIGYVTRYVRALQEANGIF